MKHIDRAAEIVTSLTIDLSTALDNLTEEKVLRFALQKRVAEHVTTIEAKCAEIRCLREKVARLERTEADLRKCLALPN